MKKLLLLLVAFCATFASCEDDDDKFEENPSAFIGTTWEYVEEYTDDDGIKCKELMFFKFENESKLKATSKYFENGKVIEETTLEGTYSVDENKLFLTMEMDGDKYTEVAIIDGGKFTITHQSEEGTETIVFKKK